MKPHILVVDDIENNLMSIESILEADGYRITKAASGRQALQILLKEFDFALILMDVEMPNLNGFETAQLIYEREKLRHVPIIFITAHSYGDENMFKGYLTGAVDYIFKPINPVLLRAKVAVFVELYKKNHALIVQEQKLKIINKNLESEIAERKNSEEKINALNKQLLESVDRLEAANRDLDRFAFMASHDLQEPLRKIRVYNNYLHSRCKDLQNSDAVTYTQRIEKSAERMQSLIKDILMFSRIANDKKEFELIDLSGLMNDVLSELDHIVQEKNARVMCDSLPSVWVYPRLIRPLFLNLINNALKYSKKDEAPVIKVYSDVAEKTSVGPEALTNQKFVRIYVEDNGIGFEQEYAEKIFNMFQRLHNANEFEGTGIGLAFCKKIVEEHGGYISAISKVGEGSTFIVSLPVIN